MNIYITDFKAAPAQISHLVSSIDHRLKKIEGTALFQQRELGDRNIYNVL